MVFLVLLAIPLLIAAGFFILTHKTIIWQEFVGHLVVAMIIAGASSGIMYCQNTQDVEIWGGRVTKKERRKVSCEHDYCCQQCENCSTDSKGNRSCTTYCCRTCYDHPYDVSWFYWTTDAGRGSISRLGRQGLKEPPRWTRIVIGDPSASSHRFENFIKGAPDTLFTKQGLTEKYKDRLPSYPGNIYDYYKINRMVLVGVSLPDLPTWNRQLMEINGLLGSTKEVSMGIVAVKNQPPEYFEALAQHWLGGKKNDLFAVVSVNSELEIQWVKVMAWTKDKLAEVQVRDAILGLETLSDPHNFTRVMAGAVSESYTRKPMADFEYLSSSITPSPTQWVIALIINILISVGLGFYFHLNEFREYSTNRYRGFRKRFFK